MGTKSAEKPISLPSKEESELARQASLALASRPPTELRVRLDDGRELVLPKAATSAIADVLTELAGGHAVTIVPVDADLTTQQAADYLNVSRPYLIGLLEAGKIAHHMVGTHRRIRFQDLAAFKAVSEKRRREIMEELAAQAQEEGMGY
ncbi:MAG: helix-turn-helix domain-containing protein [Bradyrhizobium sp.]|uniref:helix-turn-helix domain-containing protein n=1 Tax=Bradyrhizobium sp. TaxID=376 RepID=UPI001DA33607|nr:helix-turn-helix domain-containing protein [Bradyrhizobium sp.]MBV9565465.1 helix-turn-helix domain-containing protein [Bradyrhizobium sp.]